MTANQIAYWANEEKKRSNLAQEQLKQQDIAELARSNKARESETHRTNIANETIKAVEAGTKLAKVVAADIPQAAAKSISLF